MTMTTPATSTFDTCDCSFASSARVDVSDGNVAHAQDVHDRLLSIERMDTIEALTFFAEIMLDDMYAFRPVDDLDYFVGQHNWQDPASVWRVFHAFHGVAMKAHGLR
jgi:hypothetical protein